MKNQKILLAAALLALGAASCQKEEKVITQFTAGMEQSEAKTYLDGQLLKWVSGDQVKVYSDGANGADFDVTPRDGNATWAVLSGEITEGSSYTAIYPASIAASATSVTLPAVQTSPDGSLAEFPMYAESATDEFQFKNLCGALRIHLQASDVTISRIKVKASSNINGTYSISVTDGIPQLGDCTNGTATTTLILGNAQSVSGDDGRDFYIYLPAGEYSSMQLTFYQPDGTICTKSGSNVTVERSVCTPVEITNGLEFDIPEGALPGGFSVSATKQVRFAKGNLQWSATGTHAVNGGGTAAGTWRFAESQYLYLGDANINISDTNTGWIDLFGWGTSGYESAYPYLYLGDNGTITYGPGGRRSLTGNYANYDWGVYNAISNGGNVPNQWCTLTNAEWGYLLLTRTEASSKAAIGRIDMGDGTYANGCIILPDNWTLPSTCSFTAGTTDYSGNTYTLAQWTQMESAGAVFLPAAGLRVGLTVVAGTTRPDGNYWSSSAIGQDFSGCVYFDGGLVSCGGNLRYHGYSVRLAQDY